MNMKKLIVACLVAASLIAGATVASATPLRGSLGLSDRSGAGCYRSLSWGKAESSTTSVDSSQYPYCN
jgi:opacity protein-like surface antigen